MNELGPIVLLEGSHDRGPFDCGVQPLNAYLKQFALQNQKKCIVRNYVTCRGTRIVGYYSLTYGSVAVTKMPSSLARGIGKYPKPVMILARLAVDVREKSQGLGKALLKNAMLRTLQAAEIAGLKAIFVQAKDESAEQFYAKHGFIQSADDPLHMFFPLDAIQKD